MDERSLMSLLEEQIGVIGAKLQAVGHEQQKDIEALARTVSHLKSADGGFKRPAELAAERERAEVLKREQTLKAAWSYLRRQACRQIEGYNEGSPEFLALVGTLLRSSGPREMAGAAVPFEIRSSQWTSVDDVAFSVEELDPSELGRVLGFVDERVRAYCSGHGGTGWRLEALPGLEYLLVVALAAPRQRASALSS